MAPNIVIIVDHRPERKWFTSNDVVQGRIVLESKKALSMQGLVVCLEGTMKTRIEPPKPRQEALSFSEHAGTARIEHAVFQRRIQCTPTRGSPKDNESSNSKVERTTLSFATEVPLLATCCKRVRKSDNDQYSLPPSLDVRRGRLRVAVKYRIRAILKRPGPLERDVTAIEDLELKSLAPPDIHLPDSEKPLRSTAIISANDSCSISETIHSLPQYSPSIMLHLGLPSTARLRPGQPLNIMLKIFAPPEVMSDTGGLWLGSLKLRLKGTLSVNLNHALTQMAKLTEICAFAGHQAIAIDGGAGRFVIPSSLWKNVTVPLLNSSFKTCCAQYTYELEAVTRLHAPAWRSPREMTAVMPVEMQTGPDAGMPPPPSYSTT
ncbi:hypothetical protein DOTSEDRAFT_23073 [Dothistroma septosporum NZE10]|uniref:Arrestin-like N-terminal domain-containing protein n=1 Tax=Dothistroma septosporum (strain NZE10 / CBS 128990) TaxID=675120 RepID=N1PNJ3_DOTSN|nr:hypothetical protein DOTSEDRAFT_23073 [Dothistroma septosporum NZE10]